MPVMYGAVGAPSNVSAADTSNNPALQGKQGDLIVTELHGKYYTQAYRGNVYWGATALAGLTLSVVTATTGVGLTLWNPQGSGKNLVLISCIITPTTAATSGDGYGYGFVLNAGAGVATGAPLSAFTAITATRGPAVINASGQGSSVALLGGGATYTTAPLAMRGMGASVGTAAITVPATQPVIREDFDGSIIIPPGTVFIVGTTIVTSGQTATGAAFIWEECPL